MKLAITGHTRGLGKTIYDAYIERIGFSTSNGYNVAVSNIQDEIIRRSSECDVFVNNAYHGFAQVELLYKIFSLWKGDPTKLIVNISSNSSDGIKTNPHPYATHKSALDKASEQLFYQSKCHILNIRPGWLDTPRVANVTDNKIRPEVIAKIIQN